MFLTVAKDTGGLGAVLPIHRLLQKQGKQCQLVASGVAASALQALGEAFFEASSAEEVLERFGVPVVLITSMCSGGGVGRDLIPFLKDRATRVVVQDQWGVLTEWADPKYCPDYVVVNDPIGHDLICKGWPHISYESVKELGFASLDELSGFDAQRKRTEIRRRFEIRNATKVIAFFGQFETTGRAAEEFVSAVRWLPHRERVLLVGMHPRFYPHDESLHDESEQARAAFDRFPGEVIYLPISAKDRIPAYDVIVASDVAVSLYSTTLMYAAALHKPAIAILYPGSPMEAHYRTERGGTVTKYPLGELDCVLMPRSGGELTTMLAQALSGGLTAQLEPAQEKYLRTDGGNAARITEFISSL